MPSEWASRPHSPSLPAGPSCSRSSSGSVLIFWQVFPVVATAFANNPDSTDLLRFPLNYRSYFLVRLVYGAFDPTTALGILWSLGILLGIGYAKPALLPWAMLVLLAFAAFNLLFMQMVFAWVERWLAQRRTRELMGFLFILLMLGSQLIGPLLQTFGHKAKRDVHGFMDVLAPVQAILPPGLAADAIAQSVYPHYMTAFSSLVLLCAFVLAAGYCLHVRLLAQYRGENLSEVRCPIQGVQRSPALRWAGVFPDFLSPLPPCLKKKSAIFFAAAPCSSP